METLVPGANGSGKSGDGLSGNYGTRGLQEGKVAVIVLGEPSQTRSMLAALVRRDYDVALLSPLRERAVSSWLQAFVEAEGGDCLLLSGNLGEAPFVERAQQQVQQKLGQPEVFLDLRVSSVTETPLFPETLRLLQVFLDLC